MLRQLLLSAVLYKCSSSLQLHVKAGPDGKSVGDCPFAHAIRICCAVKKLNIKVLPHSPSDKPAWLVEEHGGKMPCLVADDGEVVTESRDIAKWLEAKYPEPLMDGLPGTAAAEEVTAPVFGAFA